MRPQDNSRKQTKIRHIFFIFEKKCPLHKFQITSDKINEKKKRQKGLGKKNALQNEIQNKGGFFH